MIGNSPASRTIANRETGPAYCGRNSAAEELTR